MSEYGKKIAGAIASRIRSDYFAEEWGFYGEECIQDLVRAAHIRDMDLMLDNLRRCDILYALEVMQLHWANIPDRVMVITTGKTRKEWLKGWMSLPELNGK